MKVERVDVERALGQPVSSYDVEPIDPHLRIHSVTGGVFRVRTDTGSCVLKVVRRGVDADPGDLWVSGADPSHRNYWKREWLAFDSGLLDALPGRLHAPRTLLTAQRGDDECWIWMSEVHGRTGSLLALDDYRTIAFDLGTTQGSFAAGAAPVPEWDWLARDWLRGWVGACERFVEDIRDAGALRDERLAPLRPLRDRVLALWDAREDLLAIAAGAPRTLVHCDFWPANIYATDAGTTVAIDWSQIGVGGLSQDLDQITLDPVWMQVRPDESPQVLERLVLPAYAEGVRAAGAEVTDAQVQRWYAAAAAAHYPWLVGMQVRRSHDPAVVAEQESRFGRPFADLVADRARLIEWALRLGEQALRPAH